MALTYCGTLSTLAYWALLAGLGLIILVAVLSLLFAVGAIRGR